MRRLAMAGGVFAALVLAACAPAQLRMPDGFASGATAWAVSGHSPRRFGEPVRFGPYSALGMRDGNTFSWTVPVGHMDFGSSERPYAFTLVAIGQPPVEVQCRVSSLVLGQGSVQGRVERRLELDLTGLEGPMLGCGLFHEDADRALLLELARDGVRLQGRLASPWGDYEVRSLHGYENSPVESYGPTGFEIVRDGMPVMVVDVVNGGRVLIDQRVDASQRSYLAAAAAALLLLGEDAEA